MTTLHLIPDNQPIAQADYRAAKKIIDAIEAVHRSASEYISAHGLDPEIYLPGNIWGEISKPAAFTNWTYDLVNLARLVSPFTGFHMLAWGRLDSPDGIDATKLNSVYQTIFSGELRSYELAKHVDEKLNLTERIKQSASDLIDRYGALVAGIPEKYKLSPPPRAGEIGAVHESRIIHPDLLSYQARMNALYASGALEIVERAIADRGSAEYLEIGPGNCFFAYALSQCFDGKVRAILIDLPASLANGCAYLVCAAGPSAVALMTAPLEPHAPFTLLANYLLPAVEDRLPRFDLIHNAISMNEMTAKQIEDYLGLIERRLAPGGVFHLAQGTRHLDYHEDAYAMARSHFPRQRVFEGDSINEIMTPEAPNSFFYAA